MNNVIRLGLALAIAGTGCTSVLGDISFDRSTGGAGGSGGETSSSASSSGTGGSTSSSSSSGTGGSTTSSSSSSGSVATCATVTCNEPAACVDQPTGAVCQCPSGYHDVNGDGSSCVDWDECAGENGGNNCNAFSDCVNTPGSYTCACKAGAYEYPAGSGTCIDDPCIPNLCPTQNACTNDTGTAVCTCVAFVDPSATGTGDGTSWQNAFTSIAPAIAAAKAAVKGGQASCDVWVKEGTYYLYNAATPHDGIQLQTSVGVYGGFAGTEKHRSEADPKAHKTILSGKDSAAGTTHANHVVAAYDVQNAVLDGFTIQDGQATAGPGPEDQRGGGVMLYVFNAPVNVGSSLTVSRCEITGNTGLVGGGVATAPHNNVPLSLTVTDSDIHGNSAVYAGGGVMCGGTSTCALTRTTVRSNTANEGGGLYSDSPVTADTVTFSDNIAASGDGGGMSLHNGTSASVLQNLIFSGNRAETGSRGGGLRVALTSGGITIKSAVFVGNSAAYGGAVYDDSVAGFTCVNCTITGNRGSTSGDGIRWATGAPTLTNSIVWGNPSASTPSLGKDLDPPSGSSAVLAYSDVHGYAGGTAIDADPKFATLPVFFDHVAALSVSTTSVTVPSGAVYTVGDVIEIGGDGTARTVGQVSGNTVSFTPALSAPAASGTSIRDWGAALGTLDLRLATGSPCVNTADAAQAPTTDIAGNARMGAPDMGAYESH